MIVPFELIPYMWPVIKILTEDESPMIEDLRFEYFPEHFSPGVSAHDRFERTYSKLFILAEKGLRAKFYRRIVTASYCSIFDSSWRKVEVPNIDRRSQRCSFAFEHHSKKRSV